jgi:hypothetical protein
VRRLVKIALPVLTLAAIATVLSNWHTVLRAIHMASGMHCSSPSQSLSLLTLVQPTSPNLNKTPNPNLKPIFLYPKPSSEYPCSMSTSLRPLTRTMLMTRPLNEHVPTLGSLRYPWSTCLTLDSFNAVLSEILPADHQTYNPSFRRQVSTTASLLPGLDLARLMVVLRAGIHTVRLEE